MKKMKMLIPVILVLVILSGCLPKIGLSQNSGESKGPKPGYYLVSSVGDHGDVTFFSQLDPKNGYLKLEADGSGKMMYNGVEQVLTWDESHIYWGEQTLPCVYSSYFDSELEQDDGFLTVYFLEEGISVAFRAAAEVTEV